MTSNFAPVTQLNTTLPAQIAQFVSEITGEGRLYETPSEFVCDLIYSYMEYNAHDERMEVANLLRQSIFENDYRAYDPHYGQKIIDSLN